MVAATCRAQKLQESSRLEAAMVFSPSAWAIKLANRIEWQRASEKRTAVETGCLEVSENAVHGWPLRDLLAGTGDTLCFFFFLSYVREHQHWYAGSSVFFFLILIPTCGNVSIVMLERPSFFFLN